MATTNTDVSNSALGHIGAKRIADFDDTTSPNPETVYCRLYLERTRDALIRSHFWRFAKARKVLGESDTPSFQWTNSFQLPDDFLRKVSVWDDSATTEGDTTQSYELEGNKLLINSSSCKMRYIKKTPLPDDWDDLFYETFELVFARKLVIPLSQDLKLKDDIDKDLELLMRKVRALDRAEGKKIGRDDLRTWNDARQTNFP